MLEWTSSFETGVEKIDAQHQTLFEMLNKFEADIREGKGERAFRASLVFLTGYVKNHFVYEEKCMLERHCPFAERNLNAHRQFLRTFQSFEDRLGREGFNWNLLRELHTAIEEWILNHICKIDVHLKESPVEAE